MVSLWISHRGNLNGKNIEKENHPSYILEALNAGYDVEIDVWYMDDQLYLGHDGPQYKIDIDFLKNEGLWCHSKNYKALTYLLKHNIHTFYHNNDSVVLTSKGIPWVFPGCEIDEYGICVLPENVPNTYNIDLLSSVYGICSDYIEKYKNKLLNNNGEYL